jgi:predicted nucleic acid-binding protein
MTKKTTKNKYREARVRIDKEIDELSRKHRHAIVRGSDDEARRIMSEVAQLIRRKVRLNDEETNERLKAAERCTKESEMTKNKSTKTGEKNQTSPAAPWVLGEKYIVRTVTQILTGRLIYVGEHELALADAAWIACTKRWADTLSTGALDEVEPFPGEAIVGRGSIVDAAIWLHDLPRKQQ